MKQFLKNIGIRDLGPSEQEIENWLNHIETGKLFNDAVMQARMSAYFADGIRDLEMQPIDQYEGLLRELNYVIPGRLPESDVENAIYASISHRSEPKHEAEVHALTLLTLLSLAIRNKTPDESASNTDIDHVQRQDRRLAPT